jgi:hypothetical protein
MSPAAGWYPLKPLDAQHSCSFVDLAPALRTVIDRIEDAYAVADTTLAHRRFVVTHLMSRFPSFAEHPRTTRARSTHDAERRLGDWDAT